MNNRLSILGIGGHSKIIIEIASKLSLVIDGLYDDDKQKHNRKFYGIDVMGNIDTIKNANAIIAIGDNFTRKNVFHKVGIMNWMTLKHPSAIVANDVIINNGSLIVAGVIIQADSNIGSHCIINTNSSIDHDCIINDFVHISPSATLCGNVKVGEGSLIGAGATIIPNVNIGKWCVIGAGAVITKDVPDYSLVVGIPGKIIKKLKNG
jgi:sugar O-acyltransferase (sialic acid O-acetyltransferase NeuD family)